MLLVNYEDNILKGRLFIILLKFIFRIVYDGILNNRKLRSVNEGYINQLQMLFYFDPIYVRPNDQSPGAPLPTPPWVLRPTLRWTEPTPTARKTARARRTMTSRHLNAVYAAGGTLVRKKKTAGRTATRYHGTFIDHLFSQEDSRKKQLVRHPHCKFTGGRRINMRQLHFVQRTLRPKFWERSVPWTVGCTENL